jgi:hypothetical protein
MVHDQQRAKALAVIKDLRTCPQWTTATSSPVQESCKRPLHHRQDIHRPPHLSTHTRCTSRPYGPPSPVADAAGKREYEHQPAFKLTLIGSLSIVARRSFQNFFRRLSRKSWGFSIGGYGVHTFYLLAPVSLSSPAFLEAAAKGVSATPRSLDAPRSHSFRLHWWFGTGTSPHQRMLLVGTLPSINTRIGDFPTTSGRTLSGQGHSDRS